MERSAGVAATHIWANREKWVEFDDEIYVGRTDKAYELAFCLVGVSAIPPCTKFLVVPNIKIVILMTRPLLVSRSN